MRSSRALVLLWLVAVGCGENRLNVLHGGDGGPQVRPDDGAAGPIDLGRPPMAEDAPLNGDTPVCLGAGCIPEDAAGPDAPPVAVCGNAMVETGETCDDGNSRPADGCSGLCRVEPWFTCPTPGMACQSTIRCGDGQVMASEACDDGNPSSGDGCSATCSVEAGWACTTPGQPCSQVPQARCGDGQVNAGETCDDGGNLDGDGCSVQCKLETGWSCPMPNKPCVRNEFCGDGRLNGVEQCDDRNIDPGDGCSGLCKLEPFFTCPTPGMACRSTIVCGDSQVIGDEACDDGDTSGGDGCSADCKSVEPGYSCPTASGVGGNCVMRPVDSCGDGRLTYGEYCDDGNMTAADGCSATCRVEAGYTCPAAGQACKQIGYCGDGKLSVADGEGCDDGNRTGSDGCSAACVVEANFVCPQPGMACQSTVRCGDRAITGQETCDDGNATAGDGCNAACALEAGWTCPAGATCRPTRCGDGIKVGPEGCDDGDADGGDGCSASCQLEIPGVTEGDGWVCTTPGQPCTRTVCGNNVQEGSEQCDDANNDTGDGCSPLCRKEPVCPASGGACTTACGDGLLLPSDVAAGQECDDGNTTSGDGCSAACVIESGYSCSLNPVTSDQMILPIVLRDFRGRAETNGHPDFEAFSGSGESGIVEEMLASNGKPAHVSGRKGHTVNNDPGYDDKDYFALWYKDDAAYNRTVRQFLTFTKLPTGEFQYSNGNFFPLNDLGWGNYGNTGKNFHFTSEVRYWFEYKGGERLDFTGDDDLWVFINKRLAIDLGGLHSQLTASLILDANNGTAAVCDLRASDCNNRRSVNLGLQKGSVYEIVVFHAERRTTQSNYRLTLSNFGGSRSQCSTVCGDGVRAGAEACDLGVRNTGEYGTCNADCTLPARCGDAVVNGGEECDDGTNLTTYGSTTRKCAPGCKWAPYCGDAKVDSANGEACDQAADNGKGYGYCSATCQLGPRCGDGAVTHSETCDDGVNNGTSASSCTSTCANKCGNGTLDPLEQCDDGVANNTGAYGKCSATCSLGARCGDGIKNGPETCDDGKNDGSYGTCTSMCTIGPRCGDGVVQSAAGEECDKAAENQSSPYGTGLCTTRCQRAPYCGDRAVDVAFGEGCDDGVNSGQPGSCKTDCSQAVPLSSCGDGAVQAPEQCDDGASNGAMTSSCDGRCRRKCGNGFRDTGEACDDGVNDGSYGTCNPDCSLAGWCGDGVKNGNEGCDLGAGNEENPYGPNKCTKSCTVAPYCGDGRIQSAFDEVCDGGSRCNDMCKVRPIE